MRAVRWRSLVFRQLTSAVSGTTAAPRDTMHMTSVQNTKPHSTWVRVLGLELV